MSIEHDLELMKKYDEIKSIGSMSVTISREQVMEVPFHKAERKPAPFTFDGVGR